MEKLTQRNALFIGDVYTVLESLLRDLVSCHVYASVLNTGFVDTQCVILTLLVSQKAGVKLWVSVNDLEISFIFTVSV